MWKKFWKIYFLIFFKFSSSLLAGKGEICNKKYDDLIFEENSMIEVFPDKKEDEAKKKKEKYFLRSLGHKTRKTVHILRLNRLIKCASTLVEDQYGGYASSLQGLSIFNALSKSLEGESYEYEFLAKKCEKILAGYKKRVLKQKEVERVFQEVENPLVKVLADMEFEGVRVDVGFLNEYSKELEKEAKIAEEAVYKTAGVRFNLASPKQLGEVLFEKLMLDPKAKRTKTGQYATGEDVLQKLAHQFPIVSDILAFRQLTKLKSTYVDALPELINPKTGRVHTTYGQAVAVTGRLASNNPNLQNIPVRSDRGKEIRKAFIPRDKDHILISADYSQIELRVVAAISGDPNMCEAFRLGKDIHTATAAKVYGIAEEDVTKEMRYKAKSVNFGIIYGQGAFGLADNLGISRTEAKTIIDNYKKEFSGITGYMDSTINFAREKGYVETLMGRKRWLRDINSSNFTVRGFAERNAINSPIQGTAADMIKLAMIKVSKAIKKEGFKSKMILQVHDELIFDALRSEAEALKACILENMESALPLPNLVPVIAEAGMGENWLEAH